LLKKHFVVEITLKFRLGRNRLYEARFCQLTSMSECDFTSRKFSSTTKALMNPVTCFINTDGQTFGSSAVSLFQRFG